MVVHGVDRGFLGKIVGRRAVSDVNVLGGQMGGLCKGRRERGLYLLGRVVNDDCRRVRDIIEELDKAPRPCEHRRHSIITVGIN